MKTTKFLLLTLLISAVYACSPDDIEEPREPESREIPAPGPGETILLGIEEDRPNGHTGQGVLTYKGAVYLNNDARTITTHYPSMNDSMERRFFDNAWRLTKIVRYHRDFVHDPFIGDSVTITRPSSGVFDIRYGAGGVTRCTVTPANGGGKNIYITDSLGSPLYYRKYSINKDDLITELKLNYRSGQMLRKSNYYQYNAARQFTTLIDTNLFNNPFTYAYEHTIKKNTSSASELIAIHKKMIGPDLEFFLHDDMEEYINPLEYMYKITEIFSNFNALQNGLITSQSFTVRKSEDGINFAPAPGSKLNTREATYNAQGKLTSLKSFGDGVFERELRFNY